MLKIMVGTTVALMSVGVLVLGGCATTGVGEIRSSSDTAPASNASPPTSGGPGLEFDRRFDLYEIPQAL